MEERERIVEVEREPVVERHTTVVSTGGGRSGGTGLAVLLLVAAIVVLFLLFGRGLLGGAADKTDIDVKVETPDVDLPKVDPPAKPSS